MKPVKLIAILLLCIVPAFYVSGQISPGDLADPHAHLEGMSNCTKCHSLGAKIADDKCLACHKEIKVRIDQRKGYHASAKVYKKSCIICHSDHHGRKYDILHFDITKFDHNTAGYKLEGAHSKKECKDCHKAELINDPVIKKKKKTYLGLNTQCLTCHEDYHQKTLSTKCDDCHSNEKFKPASGFDHGKSKFILKGQHKNVDCKKCHAIKIQNGKEFQEFKGIQFKSCVNCHEDAHHNQFGQNCTECHSEESFHIIKGISNFDHNKTGFTLVGKHINVTCKACHKVSITAPLKHNRCTDCHIDYHKGQFTKQGIAPDCKECHSEKGFPGSSFTIERHANNNFKLEGAHIATPCIACHKKTDVWSFRQIGIKCNDCHTDIHQTYLDPKYYPEANCLKCHTVDQWTQVSFDHEQTKYPLTGKHKVQTCRSCHNNKTNVVNTDNNLRFTGLTSECYNCHADDNHAGQFDVKGKTDCSKCHLPDGWLTTSFDHNNARFKLDGRHKDVACIKCHPSVEGAVKPYVLYKTGKIRCENCH
jgi:hypothetical protein